MIVNGKDIKVDYRAIQNIQQKIDLTPEMPETTKVELPKKEVRDLRDNSYNYGYGLEGLNFGNQFNSDNNALTIGGDINGINRAEYYDTFQEMSRHNFVHRGLQIIADDGCQKNIEGNVVKVYSDDEDIKGILENLFYKRLNLNKELWSIIYETCKLGDNFYEIIPDSYEKPTQVSRIRYLDPKKVNRVEKNGKLAYYTYTAENIDPNGSVGGERKDQNTTIYNLEPWQIIHFKIAGKDFNRGAYGESLLMSGVNAYRRLSLLEDSVVIYRLARVSERRVFKIDVGNLSTTEANRAIQKIKDNYRSNQVMDDKGRINKTAAALSLTQDIFVPVREGQSGTSIETLQAGTGLNNIDDIKYFRDEVLWTLNIPSEYLGLSDNSQTSKGSLAMQDVKFARFVERIQYYIEEGLTKIAAIELFFKKKKKDELNNFRIELTPPSNVKEIMDIEYLNQKMNLIQSMAATNMFPTDYILKYVMKLSRKEISDLKFFKSAESQQQQDAGMGFGTGMGLGTGMGAGVDMAGGMGGVDMNLPQQDMGLQQPAMSVTTENMVNIFGKDVLIENQKDFAKLMKMAEEYDIKKKIDEKAAMSDLLKEASEVFNRKKPITQNSFNLLSENELGGLAFSDKTVKIFKKGVKEKNGVILEETIEL